jgi:hypothetical protein
VLSLDLLDKMLKCEHAPGKAPGKPWCSMWSAGKKIGL